MTDPAPLDAYLLALPETAGSSLYGMVDVLTITGAAWRNLAGEEPGPPLIKTHIVAQTREPFTCGYGIPVQPEFAISDVRAPEILILMDVWISENDPMTDRYKDVKEWLKECHAAGTTIYSACSGSVLLAAAGLLDNLDATSHWAFEDLFRRNFPAVRFDPAPSICFSDAEGRLVTAGGTSSWHDLALHIISRHVSPGEAVQTAKFFLLKQHTEGQLPYTNRARRVDHADRVVRQAENWLSENYRDPDPVAGVLAECGIAERSLKRRFRQATGVTLITYAQNLRIEAAKKELETTQRSVDEIASDVGYENVAFFRRLFKRGTGLSPSEYRRMFAPLQTGLRGGVRAATK